MTSNTQTNLYVTASEKEIFLIRKAALIASKFNEFSGENLQAGRNSLAYDPIIDDSMTVDLVIVVLAWWNEQRAPHFEAIRQGIAAALAHKFQLFKSEFFLNVVGAPADVRIDPYDFTKGPLNIDQPVRLNLFEVLVEEVREGVERSLGLPVAEDEDNPREHWAVLRSTQTVNALPDNLLVRAFADCRYKHPEILDMDTNTDSTRDAMRECLNYALYKELGLDEIAEGMKYIHSSNASQPVRQLYTDPLDPGRTAGP